MKANYVHKDTLTATDYVELNKDNELLMIYNQALLKEKKELKQKYENAIEPYQKQINKLEKKLYYLTKDIEALYLAGKELINSIDKDYLEMIIDLDEPKAYFKKPELVKMTVKRIAVPIKQDLLENYIYWINYYKSKHELGDDK